MKKQTIRNTLTLLIILLQQTFVNAQWTDTGNTISTNDDVHISNGNARIVNVGSNRAALDLYDQDNSRYLRTYASGGDGYFRVQGTSPGALRFFPGNTERVTFGSNGFVGIGTASPSQLLHLKSSNPYFRFELDPGQFSMIEWHEAANRVAGIEWRGHLTPNRLSIHTGTTGLIERFVVTENGHVGIGVSDPQRKFTIGGENGAILGFKTLDDLGWATYAKASEDYSIFEYTNTGWTQGIDRLTIKRGGKLGLGTTNPRNRIEIVGEASDAVIRISTPAESTNQSSWIYHDAGGTLKSAIGYRHTTDALTLYHNAADRLIINNEGKVGIGTTDPGNAQLAVAGKISASEVVVEINPGQGPDFVFTDSYELRTLEATRAFIEQHQHLPEIPSAREMEANGIGLAEMNMKLLQKIEELTLYQIALLERVKKLEEKDARIEELEAGPSALKKTEMNK